MYLPNHASRRCPQTVFDRSERSNRVRTHAPKNPMCSALSLQACSIAQHTTATKSSHVGYLVLVDEPAHTSKAARYALWHSVHASSAMQVAASAAQTLLLLVALVVSKALIMWAVGSTTSLEVQASATHPATTEKAVVTSFLRMALLLFSWLCVETDPTTYL